MSSAPHDPFRLPIRILTLGGLAGLAVLTLMDRGATRMFATPWILILAAILAAPPLALLLRLAGPAAPIRLPSRSWLMLAVATVSIPVVSALVIFPIMLCPWPDAGTMWTIPAANGRSWAPAQG